MDLDRLTEVGKALNNSYRVKIIEFCDVAHNISEIKKKINLSYKTTYNHVRILEKARLVGTEVEINEKGKNVMVRALIKIEDRKIKNLK